MPKSYTLAYIIVAIFLSSCGVSKNSKSTNDARSFVQASHASFNCKKAESDELIVRSKNLISKIETLSFSSGRQFLVDANHFLFQTGTLYSPLILGKEEISENYNLANSILINRSESSLSSDEWIELIQRKDFLKNIVDRWTFQQCHLPHLISNENEELNDFLSMESQFCKDDCLLVSDRRLIEKSDNQIRKKVISMCSLIERKSKCAVDFDLAQVLKKRDQHIVTILKRVRPYFKESIYGAKKAGVDISCSKNNDIYSLEIGINRNSNYPEIKNAIKSYWDNDKVNFNFKETLNGLQIVQTDQSASYVSSEAPNTITLSRNVSGDIKSKTIAHEFGHIIGFRDCYLEYFNFDEKEIVYIELDRETGNLMCSLISGNKIPGHYQESLIKKYCD